MSLVNSLINQVGREIGKDLYWSAKSAIVSRGHSTNRRVDSEVSVDENSQWSKLVKGKKWSNKMRFSAMITDIEETISVIDENINPRCFGWRDIYKDLDDKIDDLKLHCKESEVEELERVDKLNFISYSVSLERHKRWVKEIVLPSVSDLNLPSKGYIFFLSIWGLASGPLKRGGLNAFAEVLMALIWWSAISYGVFVMLTDSNTKLGLALIGIGLFLYLLVLAGDFIVLSDMKKQSSAINSKRIAIENYLNQL